MFNFNPRKGWKLWKEYSLEWFDRSSNKYIAYDLTINGLAKPSPIFGNDGRAFLFKLDEYGREYRD